ncbi:MAG: hypothetical protein M1814_000229 [Vezdaea aestivalis]|nr:MAG: hypothetical protein M1814_000229 [Vezdaea aestivalis]
MEVPEWIYKGLDKIIRPFDSDGVPTPSIPNPSKLLSPFRSGRYTKDFEFRDDGELYRKGGRDSVWRDARSKDEDARDTALLFKVYHFLGSTVLEMLEDCMYEKVKRNEEQAGFFIGSDDCPESAGLARLIAEYFLVTDDRGKTPKFDTSPQPILTERMADGINYFRNCVVHRRELSQDDLLTLLETIRQTFLQVLADRHRAHCIEQFRVLIKEIGRKRTARRQGLLQDAAYQQNLNNRIQAARLAKAELTKAKANGEPLKYEPGQAQEAKSKFPEFSKWYD